MKPLHTLKLLLPAALTASALMLSPAGLGAAWAQGKAGRLADSPVSSVLAVPDEVHAIAAEPAVAAQRQDNEPGAAPTATRKSTTAAGAGARATTATIHGSVFYNDRRTDGLFAQQRQDKNGNPGQRCSISGKRDGTAGAACSLNWLAGRYMVVDVIERDMPMNPKVAVGCATETILTSATVGSDGKFTATFGTNDPCTNDLLADSAIELRVRLRYCNWESYCFSINRSPGRPYTLSHPNASASKPLTVKAGADFTVAAMNYSTAADPSKPNNDSIAANYYASIVDTVLTLHKDNPIPFFYDPFGELEYVFPSTESISATTNSTSEVVISTFQSQPASANGAFAWVDGKTPAHEYGHVMMLRTWGGAYGFVGIGITAKPDIKADSQQIAFKEAWAEFIPRVVFPLTRGCERPSYDINGATANCSVINQAIAQLEQQIKEQLDLITKLQGRPGEEFATGQLRNLEAQLAAKQAELAKCQATFTTTDLPGGLGEGTWWRDNITKALCDWYDHTPDDDARMAGAGDHFNSEDIYSMWSNLNRMRLDAAQYGGKVSNPGLWFCDYVNYYLNVRKSVSAVGAGVHADYENSIRDLIFNNNIGCSMATPK